MKNLAGKLLIIGIVSFSIGIIGCKKSESIQNKFTYDLKDYILNRGIQVSIGETSHTPATYEFDVKLTGPGIQYDITSLDYTGTGNFIEFTLFSKDPESLPEGLYTYDIFSSKDSLTFINSAIGINYSVSPASGDVYEIKTGVVKVERNGNIYTLNIELYTADDKSIKGFYNGLIDIDSPLANTKNLLPN